jgi:hypothetical protein
VATRWSGPNLDELGPRFPDMSMPYDEALQALAAEAALELGIRLQRGVYVAVTGPNLETRAEYRMLRALGADLVGMSTVPEVIVARHMDMRVLALSVVTDLCLPDALEPTDIDTIIGIAAQAEPVLARLVTAVLQRLPSAVPATAPAGGVDEVSGVPAGGQRAGGRGPGRWREEDLFRRTLERRRAASSSSSSRVRPRRTAVRASITC